MALLDGLISAWAPKYDGDVTDHASGSDWTVAGSPSYFKDNGTSGDRRYYALLDADSKYFWKEVTDLSIINASGSTLLVRARSARTQTDQVMVATADSVDTDPIFQISTGTSAASQSAARGRYASNGGSVHVDQDGVSASLWSSGSDWHTYIFSYDPNDSGQEVKMIVDGQTDVIAAHNSSPGATTFNRISIGGIYRATLTFPTRMEVRNVYFWNRPLTADEANDVTNDVDQIVRNEPSVGLIHAFSQPSASDLTNIFGGAWTQSGSYLNGIDWFSDDGISGNDRAYVQFSNDSRVIFTSQSSPTIDSTGNVSVVARFSSSRSSLDQYITSLGSDFDNDPVINLGTGNANAGALRVFYRNEFGSTIISSETSNTDSGLSSSGWVSAGWSHDIAFPQNLSTVFAINGEYDSHISWQNLAAPNGMDVNHVSIGALVRSTASQYFRGKIRTVYYYSRKLSLRELQYLTSDTTNLDSVLTKIIARNVLTAGDDTNRLLYQPANAAFYPGNLYLMWVASRAITGPVNTPTIGTENMTWEQVGNTVVVDADWQLSCFRSVPSIYTSSTSSIDFSGQTQVHCAWTINEYQNVDIGGNGADAIVQIAYDSASSSDNVAPTLSTFGQTTNALTMGYWVDQQVATTPNTGLTRLSNDTGAGAEGIQIASVWDIDPDLTPTVTGPAARKWFGIALELQAQTTSTIIPIFSFTDSNLFVLNGAGLVIQ